MRYITFLIIILIATPCFAEINIKGGFSDMLCEGADASPVLEVSYEYKYENVAVEMGLSGMSMILHDTQEGTPYVGKAMGRLNTLETFIQGKFYYGDLYAGGGVGYITTYFMENYRIYEKGEEADADNEIAYRIIAGWEITEDWFLEGRYEIADLDIESNIFPAGILEAHSRLNNWAIMIGRKF